MVCRETLTISVTGEAKVADINGIALALHPAFMLGIPIRNTEPAPFVIHKTVEGDLTHGAQIRGNLHRPVKLPRNMDTVKSMLLGRDTVHCPVVSVVLLPAPFKSCLVQVGKIAEGPSGNEIVLYEPDKPFDCAFGEWMPRLAQAGLEANRAHEHLIVMLPDGMSVAVTANHHTLHVVGQDTLRDPHVKECMDHANKQILLLRVREKLNVTLSTVMTYHCETSGLEHSPVNALRVHEAPVHLVCLTRTGGIAPSAVPLRADNLPLGGKESLVVEHVFLDLRDAAFIPGVFQFRRVWQRQFTGCRVLWTEQDKAAIY